MKKTNAVVHQIAQISTPITNGTEEGGTLVQYILSMPDHIYEETTIYAVFGSEGCYLDKNESLSYLLNCYLGSESVIDWFDVDVLDEFVDSGEAENCYQSILITLLKYRVKH